jgi:uncharacterized protein (TIGR02246 family)
MMGRRTGLMAAAVLVLGFMSAGASAKEPPVRASCARITEKQVEALFDRWNRALATKNPDTVVANYAPDATLLPTVKNGPLIGPAAIRSYFVHFLEKSPQGTIDQRIVHIGCNIAYDIGLYTFELDGDQPSSTRTRVGARYTFIYAPEGGKWLIVHHHSSALPESPKP